MRRQMVLALWLLVMSGSILLGQTDTTVFKVVSDMPRFPGCEQLDTTLAFKIECAQANFLNFIYSNIRYPEEARQQDIEGTVVVSFVVEKDGAISGVTAVKDIGGGCAEEAMRIVNGMNEVGIRWVPGMVDGEPVRVQYNLPVRFKLEDPLPYILYGRDTIYTEFEKPLAFQGGDETLSAFFGENLKYPEIGNDSCSVGEMDVKILVYPNGKVAVLDVSDYNNLGFDFQFEAIRAATATMGKWEPAEYQGRKVATTYDVTLGFFPSREACQDRVKSYEEAVELANAGSELFNEGAQEEGIQKVSEAIERFPGHAGFLFVRGQMYLEQERVEEACADFHLVRGILTNEFINNLVPLICR